MSGVGVSLNRRRVVQAAVLGMALVVACVHFSARLTCRFGQLEFGSFPVRSPGARTAGWSAEVFRFADWVPVDLQAGWVQGSALHGVHLQVEPD